MLIEHIIILVKRASPKGGREEGKNEKGTHDR